MKITKSLLLCILFSFNMNLLFCQESTGRNIPLFGIGMHIEQFRTNDLMEANYTPVTRLVFNFSPSDFIRFEPEIGLNIGVNNTKDANTTIGLGIFIMKQRSKLSIYGGLRLERTKGKVKEDSYTIDFLRVMAGPAIGGEYYLGDHFSLGGELSIKLATFNSDTDNEYGYNIDTNDRSYIFTDTGLFLRFYF